MKKNNNRIGTTIVIGAMIIGMCICITRVTHTKTDNDTHKTVSTQETAETANKQVETVSHKEISGSTLPLEIGQQLEIYQIETKTDFSSLMDALEIRNGKIIIQVSNGTVLNSIGDGQDDLGYYRNYDMSKFEIGDRVQSVFIFNPDNNEVDDVVYRIDTLVQ